MFGRWAAVSVAGLFQAYTKRAGAKAFKQDPQGVSSASLGKRKMIATQNLTLVLAGVCSFIAALAHLACIVGGPTWYLAMGAGQRMAELAARDHWYPAVVTTAIASVLSVWGLYALSGAGTIRPLPLLKLALCAITAVYLVRGLFFFLLKPYFPGNSPAFWYWSSGICLVIGLLHLVGLYQMWSRL